MRHIHFRPKTPLKQHTPTRLNEVSLCGVALGILSSLPCCRHGVPRGGAAQLLGLGPHINKYQNVQVTSINVSLCFRVEVDVQHGSIILQRNMSPNEVRAMVNGSELLQHMASIHHHWSYQAKAYDFDVCLSMLKMHKNLINCQPAGRWSVLHQATEAGL